MKTKNCKTCDKSFEKPRDYSWIEWENKRKFCSHKCYSKSLNGFSRPEEIRIQISKTMKERGISPVIKWKKGKEFLFSGKNNWNWKGDNIGYGGLHRWVERELGKPDTCEHCEKSGLSGQNIHWANKDHSYKRKLEDWLRLCVFCHKQYDKCLLK